MNALFLDGPQKIRLGYLPEPIAEQNEILLKISAVGICGSDLHYYREGGIGADKIIRPFVPGHEFSGRLVGDSEESGLSAGQLVAVDPALPCGKCEWCLQGHPNLCPNVVFTGAPPFNGAMTEFISVNLAQIFPIPENLNAADAALLETLGIAIHAMNLAKPRPRESICILGCGPIGLCLVQLAQEAGVEKIYAVDPLFYRAQLAKQLGAEKIDVHPEAVADWTHGRGVDLVIEATNSMSGFQHAAKVVRIGGHIILVGIPDGDSYNITASLLRRKGLTIKFARRMGHVYPKAIDLVRNSSVDLSCIASHAFTLETAKEAFEKQANYDDGIIKSVIYPHGEDN